MSRWWVSEFEACEALADPGLADLLEIVQKPKDLTSFILLYRRWVVERAFAEMSRCRRLAKDFERSLSSCWRGYTWRPAGS